MGKSQDCFQEGIFIPSFTYATSSSSRSALSEISLVVFCFVLFFHLFKLLGLPTSATKIFFLFFLFPISIKSQGACQQILHVMLHVVEGAEEQCGVLRGGNVVGAGWGKSPFIPV